MDILRAAHTRNSLPCVICILAAGALAVLATAFAVPTFASAYTSRCEEKAHDKKVTGTVIGGVLGALAGNAIGHGGGRTGGTIIGGVAGAAVGNNLSRTHCPDGYEQRAYDERYYDTQRQPVSPRLWPEQLRLGTATQLPRRRTATPSTNKCRSAAKRLS